MTSTKICLKKCKLEAGDPENKDYVFFELTPLGRDWLLLIGGGETHIGSLAVTQQCAHKHPSQITLGIHKEGPIVDMVISKLNPLISNELLVVCGIHYENITPQQITSVLSNCKTLLNLLIKRLNS